MQRTSSVQTLALAALLACASLAHAQKTPSSAPPQLERIQEGSDTPITITPPKASPNKITEKRENGVVTEVDVKSGGSHYTMKPNVPAGNAQPGDAQSSGLRAPQWKVLEFDLSKKKKTDKEDVAPDTTPAPPPPRAN